MNRFEELIQELGKVLGISLHAEKGFICKLNINGILPINLQYDENKDLILIASLIVEIPPGRFRELVLKEALRINSEEQKIGTFAFSEKANKLALYKYLSFESLSPEKFNKLMHEFIDFSFEWYNAVNSGNLSQVSLPSSGQSTPFMGMKR